MRTPAFALVFGKGGEVIGGNDYNDGLAGTGHAARASAPADTMPTLRAGTSISCSLSLFIEVRTPETG